MPWHSPCGLARRGAPPLSRRALVTEADESLRHLLARALRRVGYRVQTAATVSEAVAYGRLLLPDLVLLGADLALGGGATLCHQLRLHSEARVVLLGVHPPDGHGGADAFLSIPFTAAELRAVLREGGEQLVAV